jgi:hypothetical protein
MRLVMTVAPQKDICPHGRTYPIKAVPIIRVIKITPVIHVPVNVYDEKKRPRDICRYIIMKIKDAPFIWQYRMMKPLLIFLIILTTDSKGK